MPFGEYTHREVPLPLSVKQQEMLREYIALLDKLNREHSGHALDDLKRLNRLRSALGDDVIRQHINAHDVGGGIFFPGTEQK